MAQNIAMSKDFLASMVGVKKPAEDTVKEETVNPEPTTEPTTETVEDTPAEIETDTAPEIDNENEVE